MHCYSKLGHNFIQFFISLISLISLISKCNLLCATNIAVNNLRRAVLRTGGEKIRQRRQRLVFYLEVYNLNIYNIFHRRNRVAFG